MNEAKSATILQKGMKAFQLGFAADRMQLSNAPTLQRVLLAGGGPGTEQIMEGGPLAVALALAASFSLPP